MSWSLTMLVVNILLAMGAGRLFCSAPDWVQKIALLNVIFAALVFVAYYTAVSFGIDVHWVVRLIALSFCYLAVLTHIGRLLLVEFGLCRNSLPRSPQSQA